MEKLIVSVVFWLIAAVIVGSVIYSFLTRYFQLSWTSANPLARAGRAITRASWKRVTLFILLAPIGLLVLAATISFYRWIGPIALDTLYESVTDRPLFARSEQREARALPQGKSVGGPLRWSDNAKIAMRKRMNYEQVGGGTAFMGIIPPTSWMDVEFSAPLHLDGSWRALLLDFGVTQRFLQPEEVALFSTALLHKDSVALELFDLPKGKHCARINNPIDAAKGSGAKVAECYIQCHNGPRSILVDVQAQPTKTFQYELEVGSDTVQILELPKSFKWLWIAPVHHGCYESYFLDKIIPSSGITYQEALAIVQGNDPVLQEYLQLPAKKFREDLPFQAILLERDGQTSVLSEALLLQQTETSGGPISLRLNVPNDHAISRVIKPAKIIVGVQL